MADRPFEFDLFRLVIVGIAFIYCDYKMKEGMLELWKDGRLKLDYFSFSFFQFLSIPIIQNSNIPIFLAIRSLRSFC